MGLAPLPAEESPDILLRPSAEPRESRPDAGRALASGDRMVFEDALVLAASTPSGLRSPPTTSRSLGDHHDHIGVLRRLSGPGIIAPRQTDRGRNHSETRSLHHHKKDWDRTPSRVRDMLAGYWPAGVTFMPAVWTFWPPSTRNAWAELAVISPVYWTFWLFFANTSVSTRSPEAWISTDESPN